MVAPFPHEMNPAAIGRRLRVIREAHRSVTQTEIAQLCSVTPQAVNNWESGRAFLALANGSAICLKFDVTLDYLYLGLMHTLKVEVAERIRAAEDRLKVGGS